MVGGVVLGVGYTLKEVYFGTMDKYKTNFEELKNRSRQRIYTHIVSIAAGRTDIDKAWQEPFVEFIQGSTMLKSW